MPIKNKFDQSNTSGSKKPSFTSWSKPPAYVPVVSTWSSSPEICFDGLALDGDDGGGSDDEDNLAYTQIVKSLKTPEGGQEPVVSVFTYSKSFPGGVTASWKVMKVCDSLFVSFSGIGSFNKECFVSLLDYAEEVLRCSYVYVLLLKQDNHAHRPLLKSFRFMGFSTLAPSVPMAGAMPGHLVLCYQIDSSDSSSDEEEN